ncbi:phenylalanine--tRNA ligase subunit alpha [Ostreibacterium oceani]|uniref:Phenylalanine--tRNA ligase alpha subunit n=1 Tax=Ostreibacterium oceani TaxID=2654998 RepID=A0A6N7F4G4_9GAMM|nr:phenylalanine--tRNA ligase subunit alpha [Ostreibacterium oceani]MPV86786.1 phenylalanine--tRNA ligase subunit alpha [Ostreibacterium oceani]
MDKELELLLTQALTLIAQEKRLDNLDKIRVEWLGKKGFFAQKMTDLSALSAEEKPKFGQLINQMKTQVQQALIDKKAALEADQLAYQLRRERLDITMPGRYREIGSRHPISLAREKIERFFTRHGFVIETGPEIEDDFHNFEALNISKDHPARDMADTFYVDDEMVLRTHTSNVQIRTMKTQQPPLRMIAPGRVYRSDSDMTHTPMFHQIEGMWIDEAVSFADLKGVLIAFLRDFFDTPDLRVRFRPSYFPFTEPSAEVDVAYGDSGWLEVLGSGMMHPKVLEAGGIDSSKYCGYAFGMGIERLAMLRYQVKDLRLFFENDVRFLHQFK